MRRTSYKHFLNLNTVFAVCNYLHKGGVFSCVNIYAEYAYILMNVTLQDPLTHEQSRRRDNIPSSYWSHI